MALNNKKIAKNLSFIVIVAGIIVVIGWIFDIAVLKSILPTFVTMKFSTAVSFVFSGLILYVIAVSQDREMAITPLVLLGSTLIIVFLMATLFVFSLIGIESGIERLFVKEEAGAVKTISPGRPSLATMFNFILVGVSGILAILKSPNLKRQLAWLGGVIGMIGIVAVLGYVFDVPLMYYSVEGFSTAMALHTAILFAILGIGLILLGRETTQPQKS